jgi:hypothetical protein
LKEDLGFFFFFFSSNFFAFMAAMLLDSLGLEALEDL